MYNVYNLIDGKSNLTLSNLTTVYSVTEHLSLIWNFLIYYKPTK